VTAVPDALDVDVDDEVTEVVLEGLEAAGRMTRPGVVDHHVQSVVLGDRVDDRVELIAVGYVEFVELGVAAGVLDGFSDRPSPSVSTSV